MLCSAPERCWEQRVGCSRAELPKTEVRAPTAEVEDLIYLLDGAHLKGLQCLSSTGAVSLHNKLPVQPKPRGVGHLLSPTQHQDQLSKSLKAQRCLHGPEGRSTSGSAPRTKGSRLWEILQHAFLYPLLAGSRPSPGDIVSTW